MSRVLNTPTVKGSTVNKIIFPQYNTIISQKEEIEINTSEKNEIIQLNDEKMAGITVNLDDIGQIYDIMEEETEEQHGMIGKKLPSNPQELYSAVVQGKISSKKATAGGKQYKIDDLRKIYRSITHAKNASSMKKGELVSFLINEAEKYKGFK